MTMFKVTWGWGGSKEFATMRAMHEWMSENEEEIAGMFKARRHVKGADGQWYELAED